MPNITLAIPEELHNKMKRHDEIKWSSIIRSIIKERLMDLEEANKIANRSKLDVKDAWEISERIKESMWKKLKVKWKKAGKL